MLFAATDLLATTAKPRSAGCGHLPLACAHPWVRNQIAVVDNTQLFQPTPARFFSTAPCRNAVSGGPRLQAPQSTANSGITWVRDRLLAKEKIRTRQPAGAPGPSRSARQRTTFSVFNTRRLPGPARTRAATASAGRPAGSAAGNRETRSPRPAARGSPSAGVTWPWLRMKPAFAGMPRRSCRAHRPPRSGLAPGTAWRASRGWRQRMHARRQAPFRG